MKLTLKNFRYHQDESYEIPDEGLTLISGERGSGKSTILDAIFFSLYGKVRKPYTHGANTCSVQLEDNNLIIYRSRKPNTLTVINDNIEYEDEVAQAIINKIYGMDDEKFQFSSYFDQKKQSSILSLPPADQLKFVELLAFSKNTHNEYRDKTIAHIKILEQSQIELKAQISLLETQIKEREMHSQSNVDIIKLPEKFNNDTSIIKNKYENLKYELSMVKSDRKNKKIELKTLKEKEAKIIEEKEKYKKYEIQLVQLEKQRNDLGKYLTDSELDDKDKIITERYNFIKNLEDINDANELEIEYNKIYKEHINEMKSKISNTKTEKIPEIELSNIKKKVNNYEENRRKYEEKYNIWLKLWNEKEDAKNKLNKVKLEFYRIFNEKITKTTTLKNKLIKITNEFSKLEKEYDNVFIEKMKCPHCQKYVVLNDEKLDKISGDCEVSENYTDNEIYDLEMKLKSKEIQIDFIEKAITNFDNYYKIYSSALPSKPEKKDLLSVKEFQALSVKLSEQKDIDKKIKLYTDQLENNILPTHLSKLKLKIENKRNGISPELCANYKSYDIKTLKDELENMKKDLTKLRIINGEYIKLTRQIKNCTTEISNSKRFLVRGSNTEKISELEKQIEEIDEKVEKYNDEFENIRDDLEIINKYESQQKTLMYIKKLKQDLIFNKNNYTHNEKRLQGANSMKKTAIDAEFVLLEKTIESINEHAKIYLDRMFQDSISVKLFVKKFTKKGDISARPSITVRVEYGGAVYDDIDELSGGERQQCDLCFLIAINDMLGSRTILLDECLNNLNAEINMSTLMFLREMCINKRIVVVSHEAVTGVFDNEIKLKRK